MNNYFGLLVLIACLCGCSSLGGSPNDGDYIKIKNYTPDASETLEVGSTIKFSYEVEYRLVSAKAGTITLVVQDAVNNSLVNKSYVVNKGKGVKLLEAELTVPMSEVVEVFTPLTPAGVKTTNVVGFKRYEVNLY